MSSCSFRGQQLNVAGLYNKSLATATAEPSRPAATTTKTTTTTTTTKTTESDSSKAKTTSAVKKAANILPEPADKGLTKGLTVDETRELNYLRALKSPERVQRDRRDYLIKKTKAVYLPLEPEIVPAAPAVAPAATTNTEAPAPAPAPAPTTA